MANSEHTVTPVPAVDDELGDVIIMLDQVAGVVHMASAVMQKRESDEELAHAWSALDLAEEKLQSIRNELCELEARCRQADLAEVRS